MTVRWLRLDRDAFAVRKAAKNVSRVQRYGPTHDKMPSEPITGFITGEREFLRIGGEVISWQENQLLRLLRLAIGIKRQVRRSYFIAQGHDHEQRCGRNPRHERRIVDAPVQVHRLQCQLVPPVWGYARLLHKVVERDPTWHCAEIGGIV